MARRIKESVDASATPKRRINISVEDEVYDLLWLHARKTVGPKGRMGVSVGQYISLLAQAHCRDWHVRANPKKAPGDDSNRLELVGRVTETAAA